MKTFTVVTLGCKVNQYESDALADQLKRNGWTRAPEGEPADLVIVNTCAVTGRAAMQSRQAIRRSVKSAPGARIAATGCYAQTSPSDIMKIDGVHCVVGHADKHRLPEIVLSGSDRPTALPAEHCPHPDGDRRFHPPEIAVLGSRTRQFLKIQDGCNAFCTYCIVPHARGRSRSMHPDTVLSHLGELAASGGREVVLTGIHIGCYGWDLDPKTDLLQLLERIDRRRPAPRQRIRLSSIEPLELTDGIIRFVAGSENICRHFHIPLQSGDDRILGKMHRPYTGAAFRQQVRHIVTRMPEAAVGVDTLIGFPGETDPAFRQTLRIIEDLPVAYLHVFPFSPRPGTPASRFPNPVDSETIRERCRIMRILGEEKKRRFYRQSFGKILDILVEDTPDPVSGRLKGFSDNYVPVEFSGNDALKKKIVPVRIDEVRADLTVLGTQCEERLKIVD